MAWTSAGYGGSNMNAGTGSFGAGTALAGYSSQGYNLNKGGVGYSSLTNMLQGNLSNVSANQNNPRVGTFSQPFNSGGGGGGGSSFGFGGAGGYSPSQVMQMNQQQYDQTNALNTSRWNQGNQYLLNAQAGYGNDPAHQNAQNLANYLGQNPDVLSRGVQAQIQNNAANMINANTGAQARQQAGILAANGQTDAGSLAAMNNNIYRQGVGQLGAVQSNLDIQAALQNRQSEMQALGANQQQSAQNYGVNQNMANSYMQNVLYQRPLDMSGYLAQGQMGAGMGGIGAGQMNQGVGIPNVGGFGQQNFLSPTSQQIGGHYNTPAGFGSLGNMNIQGAGAPGGTFSRVPPAQQGSAGSAAGNLNYYYGNDQWGYNPTNSNSIYNADGSYSNNFYGDK